MQLQHADLDQLTIERDHVAQQELVQSDQPEARNQNRTIAPAEF